MVLKLAKVERLETGIGGGVQQKLEMSSNRLEIVQGRDVFIQVVSMPRFTESIIVG